MKRAGFNVYTCTVCSCNDGNICINQDSEGKTTIGTLIMSVVPPQVSKATITLFSWF